MGVFSVKCFENFVATPFGLPDLWLETSMWQGSSLMAAWWYALMELTSVMLPLWSAGSGFFGCWRWFERDRALVIGKVWGYVFFIHGSSFSEFYQLFGFSFCLRSHLTFDLLRNFSVRFSADLPTRHIISGTSKSSPFSLRTNLLWNCSPKNNWRGRD